MRLRVLKITQQVNSVDTDARSMICRHTIASLRAGSCGLDLVRCESLQSLDQSTTARLLHKNYSLLVCMAPLTHQLRSAHTHQTVSAP